VGLEPTRDFSQRILSPLRLPFRHAHTPAAPLYTANCRISRGGTSPLDMTTPPGEIEPGGAL
jgi:hypothetical protein